VCHFAEPIPTPVITENSSPLWDNGALAKTSIPILAPINREEVCR
jgi:hypothetical protein